MRLVLCSLVCLAAGFIGYDGQAHTYAPARQHHTAQRHHVAAMLNPRPHRRSEATMRAASPTLLRSLIGGSQDSTRAPEKALRALCAEKGWKNASEFNACRQEVETHRCPHPNSTVDAHLDVVATPEKAASLRHKQSAETELVALTFNKSWCDQWWTNSTAAALRRRLHVHFAEALRVEATRKNGTEPAEGAADADTDNFDCDEGAEKWKDGWSTEKKVYCCRESGREFCEDARANAAPGPAPAPAQAPGPARGASNISDLPWIGETTAVRRGGVLDTSQCACQNRQGEDVCISTDPKRFPPACYVGYAVVSLGGGRFTCWAEKAADLSLPEQGFSGPDGEHVDAETFTGDFTDEYGPKGQSYEEKAAEACKRNVTAWCIRNGFSPGEDAEASRAAAELESKKSQAFRSGALMWPLFVVLGMAALPASL